MGIFLCFIYIALVKQEIRDEATRKNGRKAEGEIIYMRYTRGSVADVKYFNKILNTCVVDKISVSDDIFNPKIFAGERYLVFYDGENSVLSIEDVLVDYRENSIIIDDNYYKIPDVQEFEDLSDILPSVCPRD